MIVAVLATVTLPDGSSAQARIKLDLPDGQDQVEHRLVFDMDWRKVRLREVAAGR
jgi:hypothetical protein